MLVRRYGTSYACRLIILLSSDLRPSVFSRCYSFNDEIGHGLRKRVSYRPSRPEASVCWRVMPEVSQWDSMIICMVEFTLLFWYFALLVLLIACKLRWLIAGLSNFQKTSARAYFQHGPVLIDYRTVRSGTELRAWRSPRIQAQGV